MSRRKLLRFSEFSIHLPRYCIDLYDDRITTAHNRADNTHVFALWH